MKNPFKITKSDSVLKPTQKGLILVIFKHLRQKTQCLKITEKVAFNIASEASYVYILSGQKFIKLPKNGP